VPGAAFTALRRRIDSLESEREALNHQLARQQERDVQTALAREAAKRAAEAQEAETAWRAEFDAGHIL
jgi:predicted  nucleic acid-binding Zn-ribbon protein